MYGDGYYSSAVRCFIENICQKFSVVFFTLLTHECLTLSIAEFIVENTFSEKYFELK